MGFVALKYKHLDEHEFSSVAFSWAVECLVFIKFYKFKGSNPGHIYLGVNPTELNGSQL